MVAKGASETVTFLVVFNGIDFRVLPQLVKKISNSLYNRVAAVGFFMLVHNKRLGQKIDLSFITAAELELLYEKTGILQGTTVVTNGRRPDVYNTTLKISN